MIAAESHMVKDDVNARMPPRHRVDLFGRRVGPLLSRMKNGGQSVFLTQFQISINAWIVCREIIHLGMNLQPDEDLPLICRAQCFTQKRLDFRRRPVFRARPDEAAQFIRMTANGVDGETIGRLLVRVRGRAGERGPVDIRDEHESNAITLDVREQRRGAEVEPLELADMPVDIDDLLRRPVFIRRGILHRAWRWSRPGQRGDHDQDHRLDQIHHRHLPSNCGGRRSRKAANASPRSCECRKAEFQTAT